MERLTKAKIVFSLWAIWGLPFLLVIFFPTLFPVVLASGLVLCLITFWLFPRDNP